MSTKNAGRGAFALIATLIAIYSLSQFLRNSVSVIGPDLAREFNLDATQLGLLGAIFYFSFALAQIPVGLAIDHYGPRAAIVTTALIAVAGVVIFALASNFVTLAGGRLVVGAGCSSFYMGALSTYARRFPPYRFTAMAGLQLGVGTLGSLAATSPLAGASAIWGWRSAFLGVATLCAVLTLLVFIYARDEKAEGAVGRRQSIGDLLAGVVAASRVRSFWPVFFIQSTTYAAFACIAGLWGGPWLATVYGMDLDARGRVLFVMVLAQVLGLFAWGAADRWFASYRRPGLIGVVGGAGLLGLMATAPPPAPMLLPGLIVFAIFVAVTPVLTAHGRALFPIELVGRGLTLLNVGNMGGVFVQQMLTGLMIEAFGATVVDGVRVYPQAGYRAVFGLLAIEMALAAAFYLRANDPHPLKTVNNS